MTSASRAHPWTVRVGVWLLGLALVPLAGALWMTVGSVHTIDQARRDVADVHRTTDRLVVLTELRSRLLDERNWWSAQAGMRQLGIENEVARDLTGLDVDGELVATRERIDDVLASDEFGIRDRLLGIRSRVAGDEDLGEIGRELLALEAEVADLAEAHIEHLATVIGDVGDAGELNRCLQILGHAADARQAMATQFSAFWGLNFTVGAIDRREEFTKVVHQGERRQSAIDAILRLSRPDSAVRDAIADLHESQEQRIYGEAIGRLIVRELDGVRAPADGLLGITDDLTASAQIFTAGSVVTEAHLRLVDAASDEIDSAAATVDARTNARIRDAVIVAAVVAFATLSFVFAVAAVIGRPLRKLSDSAARLSAGDTDVRVKPGGPSEVRQATAALNEAVDHLARAERQATALADGRFEDPVLHEPAPGALGHSLQQAVGTLTATLADREEFRRRLSHEARHDSLTQVPNRRAVMYHLDRSLARTRRAETLLAVMFVDLDGFKAVNDLEGHPAGDAVLCTVAARLVEAVREGDQVGRLGGDEFLVVAEPVANADEAIALAERLQTVISEPVDLDGTLLAVSASIGITLVGADTAHSADEVLRDADLAVYKAKSEGRARIILCDEDLRAELEARSDVERSVRAAIERDELSVHYQPIVRPGTGDILALEALVRWNRPGIGLVRPDDFIPLSERTDLVVDIDRWVIDRVAEQLARWQDDDVLHGVPVAINISGRHLGRVDFADGVLERLYRRGVDPSLVIVEVTESALLHDLVRAAERLEVLRQHGVRVSIDDFGTGYTSLAHLRTLPVDILKIDRSFTSDTTASSLVKLIIDTGHLLGARITAEGIETPEQAEILTGLGSDELQGFLFGRPMPASALRDRLADRSGGPARREQVSPVPAPSPGSRAGL